MANAKTISLNLVSLAIRRADPRVLEINSAIRGFGPLKAVMQVLGPQKAGINQCGEN